MKKTLLTVLVFTFPIAVFAHPGKTDIYGGHLCLKGCEAWNLYYKEYHLHDKNGRPIRVAGKPKKEKPPVVSAPTEAEMPSIEPVVTVQTVTVYQSVPVPAEQPWPPVSFLWILLALFLLLLMIRLTRKKE
jgi:hypothetical protein